jgi:hypothetical protein
MMLTLIFEASKKKKWGHKGHVNNNQDVRFKIPVVKLTVTEQRAKKKRRMFMLW